MPSKFLHKFLQKFAVNYPNSHVSDFEVLLCCYACTLYFDSHFPGELGLANFHLDLPCVVRPLETGQNIPTFRIQSYQELLTRPRCVISVISYWYGFVSNIEHFRDYRTLKYSPLYTVYTTLQPKTLHISMF